MHLGLSSLLNLLHKGTPILLWIEVYYKHLKRELVCGQVSLNVDSCLGIDSFSRSYEVH